MGEPGRLSRLGSSSRRLLSLARVAGVCGVGVVAQLAVDAPGGYFGAKDEVTTAGTVYSIGIVVLGLTVMAAIVREWRAARVLEPLLLSVNVGAFVPAMISDPVVAGMVVVWNAVVLAQLLFPGSPSVSIRERFTQDEVGRWTSRYGAAVRHLALVASALTVAVVGYRLSDHFVAGVVCLVLHAGSLGIGSGLLLRLARRGNRTPLLVALIVLVAALSLGAPSLSLALLVVGEVVLLVLLTTGYEGTEELLRSFFDHPSRLVVVSFAVLVAIGSVLLTFPAAAAEETAIAPLDALFTATSASCVTGLIVLDTPRAFSPLGQAIILGLIQAGGLGIMVLSTFGTLLLGGTLGLRGEKALSEMLELTSPHHAYRLTRFIVVSTLAVEGVGAVMMTAVFARAGVPWPEAAWKGLFHSISAFCNAGFALQTDSLALFQDDPLALMVMASLIVLGGLGFVVLAGLWWRFAGPDRGQLNVQVRAVLAVSGVLLATGTVLFLVLEWGRSLGGLGFSDKVFNALFQSVTLRTAGFNSVDLGAMAPATILFMMAFMFVGASPGSTGGGIKTTTALVLLAAVRAAGSAERPVRIFDREIPGDVVRRSLAILVVSGILLAIGFFALLVAEDQPFLTLMFESVSAFGTVGLSLGATSGLGPAAKLIVIVAMFLGRVGPLTVALFLGTASRSEPRYHLPHSRLMVG